MVAVCPEECRTAGFFSTTFRQKTRHFLQEFWSQGLKERAARSHEGSEPAFSPSSNTVASGTHACNEGCPSSSTYCLLWRGCILFSLWELCPLRQLRHASVEVCRNVLLSHSTVAWLKGEFDVKKSAETPDRVVVRLAVVRVPGELQTFRV